MTVWASAAFGNECYAWLFATVSIWDKAFCGVVGVGNLVT